jgi:malate/lactate dehydrogenase
MISGERPG